MPNTIIVGYSQQKSNICKAGDTEWAHTKIIAKHIFDKLDKDNLVSCILLGDSPGDSDKQRLTNSVCKINEITLKKDIKNTYCVMVHTNATGTNELGKGAECIYYPGNEKTKTMGIRIIKELAKIGLKERVVYSNSSLHSLNSTKCNALIIEAGFHDNEEEALWIHLNLENIANAIVLGIYKALDIPYTAIEIKTWETETKKQLVELFGLLKQATEKISQLLK